MNLRDSKNNPMCDSRRKTGFVGFMAGIRSTQGLFESLVEKQPSPLKYMLMYKFSQDHLELFFGAIRSSGGFNNNPTTQQFTAAYKRLLLRNAIEGAKGNCARQDPTNILHAIDNQASSNDNHSVNITDCSLARKYDLLLRKPAEIEHDYAEIPNVLKLSEYKEASISYIAGYVGKMAAKQLLCVTCCDALGSRSHRTESKFLKLKDRGGLFKPSRSVIAVCEETEKCFEKLLASTDNDLPRSKGISDALSYAVLQNIDLSKIFCRLNEHMFDSAVEDNHIFRLVKLIARCYSKIRLHHLAKEKTTKITGTRLRKKLSKIVLFKHQ